MDGVVENNPSIGMTEYELRHYWSYMPVRALRERIIYWLGGLIGGPWLESLWYGKYSSLHQVRRRFGDRMVVEIYTKDKTWIELPMRCFLLMSSLDQNLLDEECWSWIKSQRESAGVSAPAVKAPAAAARTLKKASGVSDVLSL